MEPQRNAPCPCGSGEKYKRCCESRSRALVTPGIVILAILLIGGVAVTLATLLDYSPAPDAGRVWSEEHQHWHTAGGTDAGGPAPTSAVPPPGPAPPGKVWSAEHGHWHDAS